MQVARIALLAATLALAAPLSSQTVTNGGFETFNGALGADGGAQLIGGTTALPGWSVVGSESAFLRNGNVYLLSAHSGTGFLDLTGYSNTGFPKGVSQTLAGLTVGRSYTFSMWLGVFNGRCGVAINCSGPVSASATIGSVTQTFVQNGTAPGDVWSQFGFTFVATNTSMLLTIQGVSIPSGAAYIGLDDVSVVPAEVGVVPEPAAVALLAVGLLLLVVVSSRRRAPR